MLGQGPQKNPYGEAFPADERTRITARALLLPADAGSDEIWPLLRAELGMLGALPEVWVVDASTGEPTWGVEWLPAKVGRRTVVNIVNLRDALVEVKILRRGKPVEARNLLSLGKNQPIKSLKPMVPALAQIATERRQVD